MTEVQFVNVKPFVSSCKDLEVLYHIPSSIKISIKDYVALCEMVKSSQFTWVWAGKTVPLEQEGITVKWRKGKVTFTSEVLPKLPDGDEYFLMYCNEDGTILGESQRFQFLTDSDELSSIDLQSTPSEDVVMISMHGKKPPPTSSSEVTVLNFSNDTSSFEVISEQTYSDIVEPTAGDKEKGETEYFSQSVNCAVVPRNLAQSAITIGGSDTKGDNKQLTSSYSERNYQNAPMESTSNPENIQALIYEIETLKELISRLKDEITMKDNVIEESQAENATLKEQLALATLSNSTVLVNSPKEDKEKRILKKRIQDETKKSARLEELLDHKETKLVQSENEKTKLVAESRKIQEKLQMILQDLNRLQTENQKLNDQLHRLQAQEILPQDTTAMKTENQKALLDQVQKLQNELLLAKQQNSTVEFASNRKLENNDITNLNAPIGGDYKTTLYVKLFKQDPFVCHVCNEVLPAHTQEFTRLNHVQQCKKKLYKP